MVVSGLVALMGVSSTAEAPQAPLFVAWIRVLRGPAR
jgi:hypothetical protein